jgi:hypothetical protein
MEKAFMTVFAGTRNACLVATDLTKNSKTKSYFRYVSTPW